jgi:hypothetical protein
VLFVEILHFVQDSFWRESGRNYPEEPCDEGSRPSKSVLFVEILHFVQDSFWRESGRNVRPVWAPTNWWKSSLGLERR